MTTSVSRLFAFLAVGLLCHAAAEAQSVRGRVLDAETGQGIPGVKVTLIQDNGRKVAETLSNSRGNFQVAAGESGPHRLQTSRIGYAPATTDAFAINSQEQVVVDVTLSAAAVSLQPLTIVARQHDPRHDATEEGMYARRLTSPPLGLRRVLLPFDPEMMGATNVRDVLTNFPRTSRRRCMVVYWNGSLVNTADLAAEWLQVSVSELEAVEYYRNKMDAPAVFRDLPVYLGFENAECEIVALWPRSGRYLAEDPPLPIPARPWQMHATPAFYLLSGDDSPSAGFGLEVSVTTPIYRSLELGLSARGTAHTLDAKTTDEMTTGLNVRTFILPPGERGMLLFAVGIEPRLPVMETDRLRVLAGIRLQGTERRFSLVKNEVQRGSFANVSYGWGIGAVISAELTLNEKFNATASIRQDRLSFARYKFLEHPTDHTWSGTALQAGVGYRLGH